MGREAECICTWGDSSGKVKALLESGELILRGAMRRRVPFSEMLQVQAQEDRLSFWHQGKAISMMLGEVTASKWCKAIHAPPVTLSKKLGITPESFVWMLGETDDVELNSALMTAKALRSDGADSIIAFVDSMQQLLNVLGKTKFQLVERVPLWIVYPKGKGNPLTELDIRSSARNQGLIDSKVVSVSSTLTGLRFILRR